jgi:hypothetical protein
MPDRFRRSVPWQPGDLVTLYVATVSGLLLVFLAWLETSGAVHLRSQVRWTNVGVAGVIVLGAGNLLWLLRGRRAIGELRAFVLPRVVVETPTSATPPMLAPRVAPALVSGSSMTRFHRADCVLVVGKDVVAASESTHRRRGRTPCGVCQP